MLKKMNLPNKLTLLRIALVPFIVACMLIDFPLNYFVAGLLFGAAAITDAFDGNIARKNNLITDFGKFADPLADKILVISVLICFLNKGLGLYGIVPVIIILFREFTVTSIRLVAAANGKVIAANVWGKFKTIAQITVIGIIYAFWALIDFLTIFGVNLSQSPLESYFIFISNILIWIVTVITIISGVIYLIDNKEVISDM